MAIVFALKGSDARQVHGSHAHGPLEIKGRFTSSGPQPIDNDGGCPEWVADLLDQFPDIQQVALSGDKWGVVWQRMRTNDEATKDNQ
jgi:NaMN:DMB phosphoribosyltransferase